MEWRRQKIAEAFGPMGLDAIPNVPRQNQEPYPC
jgi:hypothetical protein